ncbi:Proline utilization trans-activator [Colletotrichum sp. SAR 10_99]|nr:Proline utilization trans-activator [Colletotrichum sp. SAR 10_96]KAJ5017501.1 Proline utilization trans-activator [Colletotrichum sp. SAR 10_99]
MSPPKTSRIIKEEMPEDCSTEKFFHTLLSRKEKYTYSRLKFDFLHPEVHLRLPPRPYAFHLLQAFEEGFSEYHWFLRKDFRDRLISESSETPQAPPPPPGSDYFEQGLMLLKMSSEEPVSEDVEALNLITWMTRGD